MTMKRWVVAVAVALCAVPSAFAMSRADRLALFQEHAAPQVRKFSYWNLIGFELLSNDTVAVWTRVNQAYLIKVMQPCPEFGFTNAISLTNSQANVVSARFDSVNYDDGQCRIASIRPVDYKAVRKAARAAEAKAEATKLAKTNG